MNMKRQRLPDGGACGRAVLIHANCKRPRLPFNRGISVKTRKSVCLSMEIQWFVAMAKMRMHAKGTVVDHCFWRPHLIVSNNLVCFCISFFNGRNNFGIIWVENMVFVYLSMPKLLNLVWNIGKNSPLISYISCHDCLIIYYLGLKCFKKLAEIFNC